MTGSYNPEAWAERSAFMAAVRAAFVRLSARERRVLQIRFGFDDGRPRTLEEAGQEFGLSRERVRQIEAKALRKLRTDEACRGWLDANEGTMVDRTPRVYSGLGHLAIDTERNLT